MRKKGKNVFNTLIKLGVFAVAGSCIRRAKEMQKSGQLNKSLLLKGIKKRRSSIEKVRTEA